MASHELQSTGAGSSACGSTWAGTHACQARQAAPKPSSPYKAGEDGGMGRRWHPAGNAWLCNSPFEHHEFTQSRSHPARIRPILKGACEFWEARLLTTTVTRPTTGAPKDVLIADSDWSPVHGPLDAGASHAVRGAGGRTTTVSYGDTSRRITLAQGRSVILHDLGR